MPATKKQFVIDRGCVFGAEHDPSFGPAWISDQTEWKKCLAFNFGPAVTQDSEDVHYFLATAEVWRFHENPQLLSEALFFKANSYSFFPKETAIEFSHLWIVKLGKLREHQLKVQGHLSPEHVNDCAKAALGARQLTPKERRIIGLIK